MSSSGGSPALSLSSTKAARSAILGLLADSPGASLPERYRSATLRFLTLLAAHLAARRGIAAPPEAGHSSIEKLAAGVRSPHRLLSEVYESLLRVELVEVEGEIRFHQAGAERKRTGAYYTPPEIAAEVVREGLAGAPKRPRVLDPAMGTGVFLVEAARVLAPEAERASLAEDCLFGMDLDPVAVRVAILALWLETGARVEVLEQHLMQGDALATGAPLGKADVVLGNPPWGAAYSAVERGRLEQRFPRAVEKNFDSAKLFVDLGSRLSRGSLGMVLPQSFLAQETHADVRAVLLGRMAPRVGLDLGSAFRSATAPACALVFGQKPGPAMIRVNASLVPAQLWTEASFSLGDGRALTLLRRLQREHPALGDGLRVRDVGLNYNRAAVSRRSLYSGEDAEHPMDRPRYRGRDFVRYGSVRRGGWLRHNAEALLLPGESLSYCRDTAALPAKIVLRQTADRLIATLDRSRMVMGRSVIAVVAESPASLLPILALLNSGPVTALYRAMAGEEGRILPQVKVARLNALPVPSPDRHVLEWKRLGELAARLLDAAGGDRAADAEIDLLVAGMYGLRADEAEVLRPGA